MARTILDSIVDLAEHPLSLLAAAEPKDYELWVPNTFANSGKIYILSATHRGDMYHIRGAMILEPHPLLVYDCTDGTKELTAYLKKPVPSETDIFLPSWTWDQLHGATNPGGDNYSKRKFTLISESAATSIIRERVKERSDKTKLAEGMAIINKDDEPKLRAELEELCAKLFEQAPKTSETTILIQCRDTGTKGGIYPELDSGTDSVVKIAASIKAIPKNGSNELNVELCGNASKIGSLHSIGEYYLKINSAKWPKETKRDIEAFFLKVAFEKKYFGMVAGFRSGGLDVFTFLGIPSISISVRQMVGEERHAQLARNHIFDRWNIQYELPRHVTTKYFGKEGNQLGSPWWAFDKSKTPTAEEKAKQSESPSGFHKYDSEIIRIGIYNAIVKLLHLDVKPFIKPTVQSREFYNTICRPCYFSDLDKNAIHEFLEAEMALEKQDFETRKAQIVERNEAGQDYAKCEEEMKKEWEKILKKHPASKHVSST